MRYVKVVQEGQARQRLCAGYAVPAQVRGLKQGEVDDRVDVGNPGVCRHQPDVALAHVVQTAAKGVKTFLDVRPIKRESSGCRSADVFASLVSAYPCLDLGGRGLLLPVVGGFCSASGATACRLGTRNIRRRPGSFGLRPPQQLF